MTNSVIIDIKIKTKIKHLYISIKIARIKLYATILTFFRDYYIE